MRARTSPSETSSVANNPLPATLLGVVHIWMDGDRAMPAVCVHQFCRVVSAGVGFRKLRSGDDVMQSSVGSVEEVVPAAIVAVIDITDSGRTTGGLLLVVVLLVPVVLNVDNACAADMLTPAATTSSRCRCRSNGDGDGSTCL